MARWAEMEEHEFERENTETRRQQSGLRGGCHRPLSFTTGNAVHHQWPPCRVDTLCNHLALMGLERVRLEFFKAPLG